MKAIILFARQAQRWFTVYGLQQSAFIMLISATAMVPRLAIAQNLFEPYRLSGPPIPFSDVSISGLQISPDNSRVIYLADQNTDDVQELFSVPIEGGTPVRLNSPLPVSGDVTSGSLKISPDNSRVIYIADQITNGIFELFSVPLKGGLPIRLNTPLPNGRNVFSSGAQITPDSSRVVYLADQNTSGVLELFSVPITGGIPTKLNSPLPNGADVSSDGVRISPDSSRVIYLADQNTNDVIELFSVPITGGQAVRLNTSLPSGGRVALRGLQISADSNYVTYLADQVTDNIFELFSVPIIGGAPVRLNSPLSTHNDIYATELQISADSNRVIYNRYGSIGGGFELLSVPITGGTPVSLRGFTGFFRQLRDVQISANSSHVIYISDISREEYFELYSVPIAGGVSVRLNGALSFGGDVSFDSAQISANSSRVVYLADQNFNGVTELFTVPITGGASIRLNSTLPTGGNVSSNGLQISADSTNVIYLADQSSVGDTELYSVPITGGLPIKLNSILPFGADIDTVRLSTDGLFVVYVGDQNVFDENELYAVKIAEAESGDELCLPIKAKNGAIAVLCL